LEGSSVDVSRISDEKLFDQWIFSGNDENINGI
jgi:hypothetical protein